VTSIEKALVDDEKRTRELTATNEQLKADLQHETEKVKKLLSRHYVEGFFSGFDDTNDERLREIRRLRDALNDHHSDEASRAREGRIVELEEQVKDLGGYPGKCAELQERLDTALEQIHSVKRQAEQKGVDDERRWNEARAKLNKDHTEKYAADNAKFKQAKVDLKRLAETERELMKKDQKIAELKKEVKDLKKQLKDRKDRCEKETSALRQRIALMELRHGLPLFDLTQITKNTEQVSNHLLLNYGNPANSQR
jgi:chromosome segregation ATPase